MKAHFLCPLPSTERWFDKKGKPVYEGATWNNEFLSAKTKRFGTFAISVDTVSPVLTVVALPSEKSQAAVFKVTDDLSGIKTYRALLDGKWLLMEYDAKRNALFCDLNGISTNKKHTLELTVTDSVGNQTVVAKGF